MRPETIGPYRILEPLREGGVTSVYKAAGPGGPTVALKVFSPRVPGAQPETSGTPETSATSAIVARFHRELRAVAALSHPNILQVLETGQDGDHLYVATELFGGISLERQLKDRRLTIPQSMAV